jgi:hypothetical protein
VSRSPKAKAKVKVKPISRAKLAELRGVHRSSVTRACDAGGALFDALLPRGRVDLDHPSTQAWLAAEAPSTTTAAALDLEALSQLRLCEIDERYASVQGLADHVDLRKRLAETLRIELQNAETRGELISRDLVRTHVIGLIDAMTRRLLTDTATTIVLRVTAMVTAGDTREEAAVVATDLISATLASLKSKAVRSLIGKSTRRVETSGTGGHE